jgi:hypothetical protein
MSETREVWQRRVARWRASGLTAREFSRRHGLRPATLSWWKWRLAQDGEAPAAITPAVIELRAAAVTDNRFEIVLGDRSVRVPPSFDADALGRLLAALGETR